LRKEYCTKFKETRFPDKAIAQRDENKERKKEKRSKRRRGEEE
jgi:hypothetical protein